MITTTFRAILRSAAISAACALLASTAGAQPDDLAPAYYLPYPLDSGPLNNPSGSSNVVFQTTISAGGFSFVQVHFAFAYLPPGSYLQIVSNADLSTQTLDQGALAEWGQSTAFFNGSSVSLSLVAGPFTVANQVVVDSIYVGDADLSGTNVETICGNRDTRRLSNNAAVGRLLINDKRGRTLAFGTAFIIDTPDGNDKCHLSAGHNFAGSANETYILEFNVAASDSACNPKFSPAALQFPVLKTTLTYDNRGVGRDWAVFRCGKSDAKTDYQKQGAALAIAAAIPDSGDARVTGFGRDNTASDDAGGGNASCGVCASPNGKRHRVQQTDTGRFYRTNATTLQHLVDTCAANSGSPILNEATGRVIGIHTAGGCNTGNGRNSGTRVDQDSLKLTIAGCKAVPVVLTDLQVASAADGVTLHWQLDGGSLAELSAVVVERGADAAGPYSTLSTLQPQRSMLFVDRDIRTGGTYWYRLTLEQRNGEATYTVPVRASTAAEWRTGLQVSGAQNGGGPVAIRYSIAHAGAVDLSVYDVSGRVVRRLDQQTRAAGEYLQSWDRRNADGHSVARGVYVIRLRTGGSTLTHKLVLAQ